MTLRKVLIVGGSPDSLNVNTTLRDYVLEGFRQAFPDIETISAPYDSALSAAAALKPDLAVVFGSILIEGSDYYRLAN
jgi:spore maturation protein CgeB